MRAVLVPIDGAEQAERLAAAVVLRARRERLRIDLLNVQPRFSSYLAQFLDLETRRQAQREAGEQALDGARRVLDEAGLAYATHLHVGEPARVIGVVAHELRSHEIVMLDGGHGAFGDLLQRLLIDRVIRFADAPVIVLKAPPRLARPAAKPPWRRFGYSR